MIVIDRFGLGIIGNSAEYEWLYDEIQIPVDAILTTDVYPIAPLLLSDAQNTLLRM